MYLFMYHSYRSSDKVESLQQQSQSRIAKCMSRRRRRSIWTMLTLTSVGFADTTSWNRLWSSMNNKSDPSIMLYNVLKSNNKVMANLLRGVRIRELDVIAIYELW